MQIPDSVGDWARQLEHTADIRLEITACSLEELFLRSAAALIDLLGARALSNVPHHTHRLALEATNLDNLLVDWLNELLYLVDGENEVPVAASFDVLRSDRLSASVSCLPAVRVLQGAEPKAVTYHQASVTERDAVFRAQFTIDI